MKCIYIVMIMLGLAPINIAAAETNCSGYADIDVNTLNAEVSQDRSFSVWLPAVLSRAEELQSCTSVAVIGPGNGLEWYLIDRGRRLPVEPFDPRRRPLQPSIDGTGWKLPLSSSRSQEVFWLRLRGAGVTTPGMYLGSIQAELRNSESSESELIASQTLEYWVQSSVAIQLDLASGSGLSGGSSLYRMDLGELVTGLTRQFDILITANNDIRLSIESENQGKLRHERILEHGIPYQLTLNRIQQPLDRPTSQAFRAPEGSSQWRLPVEIRILEVGDARAGDYSDILTVTANTY